MRGTTASRGGWRSVALLMSALMGVAGAWISPPPSHGLVADSGGMKAPGIVKQDGGKNKRIVGVNTDNEGIQY